MRDVKACDSISKLIFVNTIILHTQDAELSNSVRFILNLAWFETNAHRIFTRGSHRDIENRRIAHPQTRPTKAFSDRNLRASSWPHISVRYIVIKRRSNARECTVYSINRRESLRRRPMRPRPVQPLREAARDSKCDHMS